MVLPGKLPKMHFLPGLLALLLLSAVDVPRCRRFVAVAGLVLGKPYQIIYAILPHCLAQLKEEASLELNSVELFYLTWVTRSFSFSQVLTISLTLDGNFWKGCANNPHQLLGGAKW